MTKQNVMCTAEGPLQSNPSSNNEIRSSGQTVEPLVKATGFYSEPAAGPQLDRL